MPLLWRWRSVLAGRLDSPALRADAACSLVRIYLSATLLAGLLLNALLGWWWADPLAGLAMISMSLTPCAGADRLLCCG